MVLTCQRFFRWRLCFSCCFWEFAGWLESRKMHLNLSFMLVSFNKWSYDKRNTLYSPCKFFLQKSLYIHSKVRPACSWLFIFWSSNSSFMCLKCICFSVNIHSLGVLQQACRIPWIYCTSMQKIGNSAMTSYVKRMISVKTAAIISDFL